MLIVTAVTLFMGVPIAFSLGLGSLAAFLMGNTPLVVIPQRMMVNLDSFSLMAIPFFIFCGDVMAGGGVSKKLVAFVRAMVGHQRGGVGIVTILSSTIFAGISGSAAADTAAIGSLMIPAMKDEGYDAGTAASIQACAGALGPIIPPSITMIIYGSLTGLSVASLFLSGIGPGLLIAAGLCLVVFFYAKKHNLRTGTRCSRKERLHALKSAIWALILPVFILGGIMGGVFTPTEAGVIASFYAIIISMFVYKKITIKDLPRIILESAISTAAIVLIVMTASVMAWLLVKIQFPQTVATVLGTVSSNRYVVFLLAVAFVMLMGCVIETVALAIIVVPILFPIGAALGFSAIQFGCVIVLALVFAGLTPPVGILLFVSTKIARCSFQETCVKLVPYLAVEIGVMLLCIFLEPLCTFLPTLFLGG
ncbi:MAG: TRAP transporter large permease [Oscillospiraceae bacterium]|nr:TRAP transporter large permease [Oscillospiraceae bacterium]